MSEQKEIETQHRHIEHVGREFEAWLARPNWTLEEAHDWLQGHFLPPVGHDEDAFVWILRGLLWADDRGAAEAETARRLAHVLCERPDVTRPGLRPEELLYNLFMLCAGLGLAEVLGEPLLTVYNRRELRGRWMGIDLRVALTAALIANQIDKRLLPVWLSMIDGGRGDDFLIGSLVHGLDGITFLPAAEPGEPPLKEIGVALKTITDILSQEPERRADFKSFIKRVTDFYPGRPTWAFELVQLADGNRWPAWAVECLPSLCMRLEATADGLATYLAWHYILACIPKSYKYEIVSELCGNHVLIATLPEKTARFIVTVAPVIERTRLDNPFLSDRSMYGAVAGALTDLEMLANSLSDSEAAEGFREARRTVLDKANVLPDIKAIGKALRKITSTHESEQDRESMILSLAKPVKVIYPNIDLEQVAEETQSPDWVVESLKHAA